MAIRFSCPACQRVLRVEDHFAGKRSKCPGCANPLTVPASSDDAITAAPKAPAPASNGWGQSAGNGAAATGGDPGWQGVRGGLKVLRVAMILQVCTTLLLTAFFGVVMFTGAALVFQLINAFQNRGSNPPGQLQAPEPDMPVMPTPTPGEDFAALGMGLIAGLACFGLVVGSLMFVTYILEVVGYAKWLAVPRSAGGYGFAMTTLLCKLFIIAAVLIAGVVGAAHQRAGEVTSNILNLMYHGISLAGFVCGLLFIRQIGVALDDAPTRSSVVSYVIWLVVFIAVVMLTSCVGGMAFVFLTAGSGPDALAKIGATGAIIGLGVLGFIGIFWLVMVVKYFSMLNTAIRAIDARGAAA